LAHWRRIDPTATPALERLAELAPRASRPDRVAELRRRKAEIERAMAAYRDRLWSDRPLRTAADRAGLARMAEAAGRPHEARALYTWAIKADSGEPSAREGLDRLDGSAALPTDTHTTRGDTSAELASKSSPPRH